MAPLTTEPDAIRVVLNMARRKAFYALVGEIAAYMRAQLELREGEGEGGWDGGHQSGRHGSSGGGGDGGSGGIPPTHSPALVRLRRSALRHFDAWRSETQRALKDVVSKADDNKILEARRKRGEELMEEEKKEKGKNARVGRGEDLLSFDETNDKPPEDYEKGGVEAEGKGKGTRDAQNEDEEEEEEEGGAERKNLQAFQNLYHPIPTRLTTIPRRDREEVLSATMLLLLSAGKYSAYARCFLCYLASALDIPPETLDREEVEIATTLVETVKKADAEKGAGGGAMSADSEAAKRREQGRAGRLWKVGLASVAGAAVIGVTGGLAAPVVAGVVGGIMGSVGLGGLAGFLGIFWMNGALVGALFGAFGAKMTGEMADRYAREVEDFKFLPLRGDGTAVGNATGAGGGTGTGTDADMEAQARRLRVTIGINGWLDSADDVVAPWRALPQTTEVFALRYEMASLLALGAQLRRLVHSAAWNYLRVELLKRTVLATVQGALWPLTLLSSASALDNPFTLARNRSDKAGAVLADALANRVQGERPVTLVGYSLGARVVYACLRELAKRQCFGVVDTVVLIGAPVPSSKEHWEMMRCVVAGRLFNVHSENDYILGFLYRGTSLQLGIAGLQAVGHAIDGVEDLDLTNEVLGHTRYPDLIPQILNRCGFGGVRGGEEKIEREDVLVEEGIGMRDSDYPELGTLIDVGDADEEARPELPPRRPGNAPAPGLPTRKPVLPPRRSTRDRLDENAKYLREIKNDPRLGDQDFFLVDKAKATATTTTSSSSGTRPPIRLSDAGPSLSAPDVLEKEKERGPGLGAEAEQRAASFSSPATYGEPTSVFASNVASASYGAREHRVDSEDEYGDAPITMMDDDELSDGELAMVEPLCIDDEVPVKGQAQTGR